MRGLGSLHPPSPVLAPPPTQIMRPSQDVIRVAEPGLQTRHPEMCLEDLGCDIGDTADGLLRSSFDPQQRGVYLDGNWTVLLVHA